MEVIVNEHPVHKIYTQVGNLTHEISKNGKKKKEVKKRLLKERAQLCCYPPKRKTVRDGVCMCVRARTCVRERS